MGVSEANLKPAAASGAHFLEIADYDAPIYRVFKLWHFEEALRLRSLWLYPPRTWDDPHESILERCYVDFPHPVPVAEAYAQCWSATGDSDTLLRAYSFVVNDRSTERNLYPGAEGVLVRSTSRKLLNALLASLPSGASPQSCFIGKVQYCPHTKNQRLIAEILRRHGFEAFREPERRARLLLVKRPAFRHEDEVRLLYIEQRSLEKPQDRIQVRFGDPTEVFDEVTLDPRLKGFDTEDRKTMLTARGYGGPIGRWPEYQRSMLQVVLPPEPKE